MKIKSFEENNAQPLVRYPGTSAEALVRGQIVKLDSGDLTIADVTSAGTQEYLMNESATGDGATPLSAFRIQRQQNFETDTASLTTVGLKYTLNAAATGITATTTAGVFKVDEVISSTKAVGHFETVTDR